MLGRPPDSAAAAAATALKRLPGCGARRARAVIVRLPLRCGCGWRCRGKSSCWPHPLQISDSLSAKADGRQLCMLERPPLLPDKLAATAAGRCMMRKLPPSLQARRTI